ncbi:rho GTPase-activating protein 20-like [Cynocephalus volans]|uniref:rho GTPase-activating protein 20-like n=1 Tax=Cynocephalus volans TaxID=110931 RepID=UPI002FC84150
MEAMSPQQETLGGQPGRSSSLTGVSLIAMGRGTKRKMKMEAERRRRAPSHILGKALQRPSTRKSPSASVDTSAFLSSFMCSSRTLLIDAPAELKRGLQRKERHLFLFNDLFVVTKIKYNNNFKIKNKIKLSDMWTATCVDEVGEGNTNAMKSFVLGWPTVNFVATFSSPEQKEKWFSLLQRYINLEKDKDYPKSIPLKIFTKDIGNCAYSKTITVMNSDTANEVINMSLTMLRITGSERDYQLWVNSGKEAAPYPLIGHEYPYGIKMSHLRDTALLTQGSKDSTTPLNFQEPFLMEQLPKEMRCQFILKRSHLAMAQQLSDSNQKTFKRRRSILNWAFWRGSSTHQHNLPISPTSPVPGQLFGVSLPNICENDNLPKPVLDMLYFLNQKGPLTKGIFRLSASLKSCRELKEKLNSGVEVHLDCECIFVIASVLKEFLRNIPGSIFSSDLYDHWVCVMDQGNNEEKINTIQRLLDQLPRANVILLRYLFGVLHNIEQQSSSNQMTAYNLAVCITPSILWPPLSSSLEVQNEFTKKVPLLVQFLIENCCRIFGEEITSLLGETSVRCGTRENASDISCFQPSDSSHNSLENEVNGDVDAPCSDLAKKLDQSSRSMDSILTLSDHDLDQLEEEGLDQPEVEGLLTVSDFDLDQSNDEDIQMKQPLESKPMTVAVMYREALPLQEHARARSDMYTPSHLSSDARDAPKTLRRQLCCLEPSTDCLDSKLSSPEVYQKKLHKSSYDAILSQKDEDYLKQNQPLQGGDKTCFKQSSVTSTDVIEKNATNIDNQHCKLTYLRGIDSKKQHKTSCEAGLLQGEEDYLKQHKSLQMEGQKLINQSLVMGIEVGKSSATNQNTEQILLPRLSLCPKTSCSSLFSPGTFPSGSSVSCQDSPFSQTSEHSVFTPTETPSPIDCNILAQRKQGELSSDFSSSNFISGMPGPSSGQGSSHLVNTKKDSVGRHSQMRSVTLHPNTWLRNGIACLRNWSLKKKAKVARPEENKIGSLKGLSEPPPHDSGLPEANSLEERQKDMPMKSVDVLGTVQTTLSYNSSPSQESERHSSSPFSLIDSAFRLCMKSHKDVKPVGQGYSRVLCWGRASASFRTMEDMASPDI